MLIELCLELSALAMAAQGEVAIDARARAQVIDGIAAILNSDYVFPEVAKQMEDALRLAAKEGKYDRLEKPADLALRLTHDLQAVSHDRHLHVDPAPAMIRLEQGGGNEERARAAAAWGNHGFVRVERLPGNIGYLELSGFDGSEAGQTTAASAMGFLADTSALIFDLRQNGGGSPEMIVCLASYLLDEPTHLNSFYNRKKDETTETWSKAQVAGRRYGEEKPVYVLTSQRTFSAAEEFTYDLKCLQRAVIVGETTGGGAHPVFTHRLNDELVIWVPFARAINPITNTNWEGTGVEPDLKVKASDALYEAELDALAQIAKTVASPEQRAEVEDAQRRVKDVYRRY